MTFVSAVSSTATSGRLYVLAGGALCVVRTPDGAVIPHGTPAGDALVLGSLGDEVCFAWSIEKGDPLPEGTERVPMRALFGALPDEDFAIASRALGITAWDADHRHCGRCGAATVRSEKERVRTCTACGFGAHPRVSPAVIVLVEKEGRALLARNSRFPVPFHSTLAGFVEIGETLEETVVREIEEEVGVIVGDVRYFGSQPWPMGGSLMVAFTARWISGELRPDGEEIAEAAWYPPDALPTIPPKLSIARQLIDDFVERNG